MGKPTWMPIPYLACMVATASFYHLPPRVLPSIQVVEGGRPGIVSRNLDGSLDLGVMQVNSRWVPRFAALTGMSQEAVRARLVDDPCFNIAASGAIMRLYWNETGGDLLRAVGVLSLAHAVVGEWLSDKGPGRRDEAVRPSPAAHNSCGDPGLNHARNPVRAPIPLGEFARATHGPVFSVWRRVDDRFTNRAADPPRQIVMI